MKKPWVKALLGKNTKIFKDQIITCGTAYGRWEEAAKVTKITVSNDVMEITCSTSELLLECTEHSYPNLWHFLTIVSD